MLFALIKFTKLLSFSEGLSQCTSQNMHFEVIIQISRKYRDSSIQQIVVTFNWALGAGCRNRWRNTDWKWKVGNISTKLFKSSFTSPLRGDMSVLDDGVVEVPVEALLDVGHVLHLGDAVQYSTVQCSAVQYRSVQYLGDAAHRDLLPLVLVRDRGAHPASLLRLYLKISHRHHSSHPL